MILSIDEVNAILDEVCGEFPEELFQQLNGGILLLEEALPDQIGRASCRERV